MIEVQIRGRYPASLDSEIARLEAWLDESSDFADDQTDTRNALAALRKLDDAFKSIVDVSSVVALEYRRDD